MALTQIKASNITDGTVVAAEIADNAITTAKINADAVTAAKMADDAIDSAQIADGAVDNVHLATGVDAAKLTTGTLPMARLSGTLPALNGSALTALNATQLTSGTIPIARIADDAVTNAKMANDAIDSAQIADNAVTLAKMAGGTDGQIITYDASGNPVAVGPGTDGQVLTSTGAGSPPAFEDATGGVDGITSSANATAITIDSDEKVGIVTTTPGSYEAEASQFVVGTTSGNNGMSIASGTSNVGSIYFADGTSGNAKYRGFITYTHTTDKFDFGTGANTRMTIDQHGRITKPAQPCFLSCLTSRNSNVTGAGAGYSTWGKTFTDIYDIGSNFSNGLFTAPVTGKYILFGSLYFINTVTNNNQTIIYVQTSNRTYNALRSHGHNIFPYQGNFSFSIVADMDASDTFYITCNMYGHSSNTVHIEASGTPINGTYMGATLIA